LTDKGFSSRLKDLFKYKPDYDITDLHLLKIGRHFRISDNLKFIVGKDEKENEKLTSFSKEGDFIFDALDIPSPIGLGCRHRSVTGHYAQEDIELMASILTRYSDSNGNSVNVSYKALPSQEWKSFLSTPAAESLLDSLRI
jgi:predicted ribosome quality control (RQC) complex YloA/Tae2 family protein